MPVFYHLIKRKVLAGAEAGKEKYFAQVRVASTVGMEQLCEEAAELSTVTPGDVKIVLNGLVSALCSYLSGGYVVPVGDLGNFRLSAGSEGVKHADDFKLHMMRNPKILFSPGRLLRKLLKNLHYVRIKPKQVVVFPICTEPHVENNG